MPSSGCRAAYARRPGTYVGSVAMDEVLSPEGTSSRRLVTVSVPLVMLVGHGELSRQRSAGKPVRESAVRHGQQLCGVRDALVGCMERNDPPRRDRDLMQR